MFVYAVVGGRKINSIDHKNVYNNSLASLLDPHMCHGTHQLHQQPSFSIKRMRHFSNAFYTIYYKFFVVAFTNDLLHKNTDLAHTHNVYIDVHMYVSQYMYILLV